MELQRNADVVVVGAGLAGLAAAALLAREGRRVVVLERSKRTGGRGGSKREDGFSLDLGPHAFYVGGPARKVLASLGIHPDGVNPVDVTEQYMQLEGGLHLLPNTFGALWRTTGLSVGEKFEMTRLFARLTRMDTHAVDRLTLAEWLGLQVTPGPLRRFVEALFRVTNYAHAADVLSAGAAIRQLRTGLKTVRYLHGGWASLVDAVEHAAAQAGAELQRHARVASVLGTGAAEGVVLDDGTRVHASEVLIATTPDVALELTGDEHLRAQVAGLRAARVASLSVGLDAPYHGKAFILGTDAPVYLSAQSLVARIAPPDGALIHVARYLHPDEEVDASQVQRELEALLDVACAGTASADWRAHVALRQFLPNLTVTHGLAPAAIGGEAGRPGVALARPGVYLCGDWVGGEGALLNAALASARAAVEAILERSLLRRSA